MTAQGQQSGYVIRVRGVAWYCGTAEPMAFMAGDVEQAQRFPTLADAAWVAQRLAARNRCEIWSYRAAVESQL